MNNPKTNSSIFNLPGSTAAIVMWSIALLFSLTTISFVFVLACVAILLFEKDSAYFRSHVSQLLALMIFYTLFDIVFTLAFGTSTFFVIRLLRFVTNFAIMILRLALILLKAAFCFVGLSRAIKNREPNIPFLMGLATYLNKLITPGSLSA